MLCWVPFLPSSCGISGAFKSAKRPRSKAGHSAAPGEFGVRKKAWKGNPGVGG